MEIFKKRVALSGAGAPPADSALADLFHENTKLRRANIDRPDFAASYDLRDLEAMARAYKRYHLYPQVALPQARAVETPFAEVMEARRSRRGFGSRPIELAELSTLLRLSYGVTGSAPIDGGSVQALRAAPSAGALYPAEIYLSARAVAGLEPGLYHYEVPGASLARLARGDFADRLCDICCGQDYARQASMVVLISAVVERTRRKYGDRGYRYALLDIGHLGQNLCLACTALDLSIVTTCGFFDDEAADFLGIDGCDEAVIYVAFIGPRGD